MFCIYPSAKNVFAFQVFTPEFCQEFIEEINHFENTELPKGRPNTMNNCGVCRSVFTISIITMVVLRFSKSEPRRRQCLFDSRIAESTSSGLSDMTFLARCLQLKNLWVCSYGMVR